MSSKAELRARLIAAHRSLSLRYVELASRTTAEKAFSTVRWSEVKSILAYRPLSGEGEIDPQFLLDRLPNRDIMYVEASKNAPFPGKHYDVILLPVLGFDHDNYRLGRGGGWYDRLLQAQPQAVTIGLAHDFAQVDVLPHEPHDVPITFILTS